jgi:poly(A) polymerase
MRAIKFSARLGFTIERKTLAAMKKYHSCILTASVPRVCEEVFRLFTYGRSRQAFRMMWECGLLADLLPELSRFVDRSGGARSVLFSYLGTLDKYEEMMSERGLEVSNALRAAVLMSPLYFAEKKKEGAGRRVMQQMMNSLKIPKAVYFTATLLMESTRRLAQPPSKGKSRFVYNRDFLDALDFNRIIARSEKRDEGVLNEWSDFYEKKGTTE